MKVLHWTYIQIGLRLVALIFYFYVTTCGCNIFAKASKFYIRSHLNLLGENNMWLQHKIINFETADVSWVRTHGAHHPALSYHNANIENRAIDIMQRILHPQNRIDFSTHWLPPKTATVKFSPQSTIYDIFVNKYFNCFSWLRYFLKYGKQFKLVSEKDLESLQHL